MNIINDLAEEVVRDARAVHFKPVRVAQVSRRIEADEGSDCGKHGPRERDVQTILCDLISPTISEIEDEKGDILARARFSRAMSKS